MQSNRVGLSISTDRGWIWRGGVQGGAETSPINHHSPPGGARGLQLNSNTTSTFMFVFYNIYLGINNKKSLLFITFVQHTVFLETVNAVLNEA